MNEYDYETIERSIEVIADELEEKIVDAIFDEFNQNKRCRILGLDVHMNYFGLGFCHVI